MFNKDDQDFLQMGFNATFDVQVGRFQVPLYMLLTRSYLDDQGAEGLRPYRTCDLCRQEVGMRRRDGNWYWSDISMENQFHHTPDICCYLFRGGYSCGSTSFSWIPGSYPIRYPLSTCIGADALARDNDRSKLCRTQFS